MAKRASGEYTGDLLTPIEPARAVGLALDRSEFEAETKRIPSEYSRKLGLLFDHYGIDRSTRTAVAELCDRLIQAHVPGMRIEAVRRRGRPSYWTESKCFDFVVEVMTLARQLTPSGRPRGVIGACRLLADSGKYRSRKARSLERRYGEARKDPAIAAHIDAYLELVNAHRPPEDRE